jgi:putative intracellular protease/amidase
MCVGGAGRVLNPCVFETRPVIQICEGTAIMKRAGCANGVEDTIEISHEDYVHMVGLW